MENCGILEEEKSRLMLIDKGARWPGVDGGEVSILESQRGNRRS